MITLEIYKENARDDTGNYHPIYNLDFYDKINLIVGDSGSGKTYFADALAKALKGSKPWKYKCFNHLNPDIGVDVMVISSMNGIDSILMSNENYVIVLDEQATIELRKQNKLSLIKVSKNYFILMDRQLEINIDVNIKSIFKFRMVRWNRFKTFKFECYFKIKEIDINNDQVDDIHNMIAEDTTSGKIFWEKVFGKLKLLQYKNYGNGSIRENAELALKEIDGNLLVAVDYDKGGIALNLLCTDSTVDLSRLYFIPYESFEEILCNSDFILSHYPKLYDLIVNYKLYMSPEYRSTGKYFSWILFNYVKQKPPIESDKKRDKTKLYKKGISYFEELLY